MLNLDVLELKRLYLEEFKTLNDIGQLYDIDPRVIKKRIATAGVTIRSKKENWALSNTRGKVSKRLPIEELKQQYLIEQKSLNQLGLKYNTDGECIKRHLIKAGVTIRNKTQAMNCPDVKKALSLQSAIDLPMEDIKDLYLNKLMSLKDIGKKYNVSWGCIRNKLALAGVTMRTQKESQSCPKSILKRTINFSKLFNTEDFKNLSYEESTTKIFQTITKEFTDEGYQAVKIDDWNINSFVYYICPKGHEGRIRINGWRHNKNRCRKCSRLTSREEQEVADYCKSLGGEIQQNIRPDFLKRKELDIYIPSKNVAIEYCGLYWHSTQYNNRNDHRDKFLACRDNGIRLITLFSDEWINKPDLVKAMIRNRLGVRPPNVIRASVCEVREISKDAAKTFFDLYHIAGYANSVHRLGLFYDSVLVSAMTFRKPYTRQEPNTIEICRYAVNYDYQIHGGFAKLLLTFKEKFGKQYKKVLSYSDCRFGLGDVYKHNKFVFKGYSQPNYWYTDGFIREFRFKHRFNKNLLHLGNTEKEQTEAQELYPIFDNGHFRWELNLEETINL